MLRLHGEQAVKPYWPGTPLNHIGLWIDDLAKAVERLTDTSISTRRFMP